MNLENSEHEINENKYSNRCLTSEYMDSTLTKKPILVLYLSWWDNNGFCIACRSELKLTSNCQKYCIHCCIFYIGCRHCLTTNIIFGFADQTQCKKCERISFIANTSNFLNSLNDFAHHDPTIG